jgi:hypothetical protein
LYANGGVVQAASPRFEPLYLSNANLSTDPMHREAGAEMQNTNTSRSQIVCDRYRPDVAQLYEIRDSIGEACECEVQWGPECCGEVSGPSRCR